MIVLHDSEFEPICLYLPALATLYSRVGPGSPEESRNYQVGIQAIAADPAAAPQIRTPADRTLLVQNNFHDSADLSASETATR